MGNRRLHSNASDSRHSSKNLLITIRKFWRMNGCSSVIDNKVKGNENPSKPVSKCFDTITEVPNQGNSILNYFFQMVESLRQKNQNCLIFGQLSISSLRNKCDLLSPEISGKFDVLVISETRQIIPILLRNFS